MRLDMSNGGDGVYLIGTAFVNGFSSPQQVLNTRIADFGVAPLYIRLSRADAFWIAEYSSDGATWYNAGQFYKQHDVFEKHWMEDTRPIRDLYQGVLQIGVALHHVETGNYRGAVKMLRRGLPRRLKRAG